MVAIVTQEKNTYIGQCTLIDKMAHIRRVPNFNRVCENNLSVANKKK